MQKENLDWIKTLSKSIKCFGLRLKDNNKTVNLNKKEKENIKDSISNEYYTDEEEIIYLQWLIDTTSSIPFGIEKVLWQDRINKLKQKKMIKNKLTPEDIEKAIVKEEYIKVGTKTTIAVLTLKNGFEVIGKSGCVDPSNYDHEIGSKVAREKAVDQVWLLEGYKLQQSMYEVSK